MLDVKRVRNTCLLSLFHAEVTTSPAKAELTFIFSLKVAIIFFAHHSSLPPCLECSWRRILCCVEWKKEKVNLLSWSLQHKSSPWGGIYFCLISWYKWHWFNYLGPQIPLVFAKCKSRILNLCCSFYMFLMIDHIYQNDLDIICFSIKF